MTVHIIAVGTSILEHFEDPATVFKKEDREASAAIEKAKPRRLLASVGDRDAASDWITAALAAPGEQPVAQRTELMRVAESARPDLWPTKISAEIATLAQPPVRVRTLPITETAYLICSDTKDGLVAGLWNAIALVGNNLNRVSYAAKPGDVAHEQGKVVIVRVSKMDAKNNDDFKDAMEGMGRLGDRLVGPEGRAADEKFHFYLSGGYKAAIPYLIGLAEGLRSLDRKRTVIAYVLHDGAKAEDPLIQLPLRSMMRGRVIAELGGFENRVRKSLPDTRLLEGYAYDVSGGECTLTPFGVGLVTLFGLGPRAVSG